MMGLNEVKLGVPIPFPGECFLRELTGGRVAREIIDSGEFYEPEDSLRMGLCDRVLPEEEVIPAAVEMAALLGSRPRHAIRAIKQGRTAAVLARVRSESEARERIFMDCWHSETTQGLLREAAEKF